MFLPGIFQWSEKPCCIFLTNGIIEVAYTSIILASIKVSSNASICSSLNGPDATTMSKRSRFFCAQKITPSTYAPGLPIGVIDLPNHCHISIIPLQGRKFVPGLIKGYQINPQIIHTFGDCVHILTIPLTQKFVQFSTLVVQSFFLGIEASKIIMRVVILRLLRSSKVQTQPSICKMYCAK
jgi:hypothetical protein